MLVAGQILKWDPARCKPLYQARKNAFGAAIGVRAPRTNDGREWSWPGPAPHPTRMHHYASLSSAQKAGWAALAAMMTNGHSPHGITTYNGPIAYMQTNLFRRISGLAYVDDAPSGSAPASVIIPSFVVPSPINGPVNVHFVP